MFGDWTDWSQECALSLYNLLEMLDHNIDNFTSQTGTDYYSGNNYVVDKNIILGLICLAEVMCGDVSQCINTDQVS